MQEHIFKSLDGPLGDVPSVVISIGGKMFYFTGETFIISVGLEQVS
jgi:hypothetical protein